MWKKTVSTFLICSQLCFTAGISAAQADPTVSAEHSLVRNVLMLKSLALSDQDMKRQLESTIERYDAEAPAQGRTERLQEALVDLGMLTSQQARSYTSGVVAADAAIAAQQIPNAQAHQRALEAQLELFARINPVGAQFSMCTAGTIVTIGGVAALITGLYLATNNPTCHKDYHAGYSCEREVCQSCTDRDGMPYDCNCRYYTTTCYPTICDIPDYYPQRDAGTITAIAGGAAIAVGVLLLIKGDHCGG